MRLLDDGYDIDLNGTLPVLWERKAASVLGPDPHVLYCTAQPKANCHDTSYPTQDTYYSLFLGTTCVQCLYTVVYRSSQVDRIYISITMGKVDGCRLWSPRLTGGRVYPDYPYPPRELINVSTTRSTSSLIVQEHRLSIAPQIVEAIPPPNKVTKSWIGILSLFKLLSYDMSIRTCTINSWLKPQFTSHAYTIVKNKYGYSSILYVVSTFCLLLFCASTWGAEFVCVVKNVR